MQLASRVRTTCPALFLWYATAAWPQGTAYVTGYTLDQTNAAVANATVVLRNQETGASVSLASNDSGLYRSPMLPAGRYEAVATASGFQRLVRRDLDLVVGQALTVDLQLVVGTNEQVVEVKASPVLLRTEDAGLGQSVQMEEVRRLPFLNRSVGMLVGLAPNVRYLGDELRGSLNPPRFVGVAVGNLNVVINGASASSERTNVNQMGYNPSVEIMSEVHVVTNQFSAEYGQDVGPLVIMNTKSGTNSFHGSVYEFFRNERLNTYNGFSNTRPVDRHNVWGGMIGGPLARNKLFFYTSHEGQKSQTGTASLLTVPTAAMKRGDFSANPERIYNPASTRTDAVTGRVVRDLFPGNVIPASVLDTPGRNAAAFFPNPDRPGFANNLTAIQYAHVPAYKGFTKLDWIIGHSDRFSGSWYFQRRDPLLNGFEAWATTDRGASPSQLNNLGRPQVFNFEETHLFSSNWFMTNRFVWRPFIVIWHPPALNPAKKWAQTLGIRGLPGQLKPDLGEDLGFPIFSFTGYVGMGDSLGDINKPSGVHEIYHSTTLVRGRHSLKVGMNAQRSEFGSQTRGAANGSYGFSPLQTGLPGTGGTGNAIASLLLGQVNTASARLGPLMGFVNWYYAPFFQDDWKVTRRLTINLGLRWDIDAPVYEVGHRGNNFDSRKINPVSGTPGVITFLTLNGAPTNFFDTSYRRWAPRFGVAFQATPKTTIRSGYGIYNGSPILGGNRRAPDLGYITSPSFISPDGGTSPAFVLGRGWPSYPLGGDPSLLNDSFGAVRVGQVPTTSPTWVDRSWKFGYTQNFNISIQRELPGSILFEAAGQGVLGRNLSVRAEWNQVPPALRGITGNAQPRRPYPQFGNVSELKSQSGTTAFYGMTLRGEKRFSQGFSFITNFAFSKNLGVLAVEDQYNPRLTRGPVMYDEGNNPTGQSFYQGMITGVYDLPFGEHRRHLNSGPLAGILGGWDIGAFFVYAGGVPFSITSGGDSLNCFCPLGSRVNIVGDPNLAQRSTARWFNTAAFAAPAFGATGNAGQGILIGPSTRSMNLSIGKNTPLPFRDGLRLRFSAEFFNFTNTPRFGVPTTDLRSPAFGRISSPASTLDGSSGSRLLQLGLRIEF